MIPVLIVYILLLAIVGFQVIQGLYSSVIMALLTTVSALVAFGFYEIIGENFLYATQGAYADAATLMGLFVVTLMILRTLSDKFLPRNITVSQLVDRIVGGVVGLYTGMIIAGVFAISVMMLPLGPSILGWQQYDKSLMPADGLSQLYPVKFTLAVVDTLSGQSLGGDRTYSSNHDNMALELFCARNDAGLMGRTDLSRDPDTSEQFEFANTGAYSPSGQFWNIQKKEMPKYPPLEHNDDSLTGGRPVMVGVSVSQNAKGEDNWYRLVGTHFRLVTHDGNSYYPIGYAPRRPNGMFGKITWAESEGDGSTPDLTKLCYTVKSVQKINDGKADLFWIYKIRSGGEMLPDVTEAGADTKTTRQTDPAYIVFRRIARSDIGPLTDVMPR